MANCGCKPCSKPLNDKPLPCKPFSVCCGNKTLVFDGECMAVMDRTYQIPDGTYTSITFTDGCITGVGTAPLPVYTPQACCDGAPTANANNAPVRTRTRRSASAVAPLEVSYGEDNLLSADGGFWAVKPSWDNSNSVLVSGYGTVDKPWKLEVKLDGNNNRLQSTANGLRVDFAVVAGENITLTGTGTTSDPYKISTAGLDLPVVNNTEYLGNGIKVKKDGRVETTADLKLVTNLEFSSNSFSVQDLGMKTMVVVDENALAKQLIALIATDEGLKAQLKQVLGA